MIAALLAASIALACTLLLTPLFVRFAHRHSLGQFIREDGPKSHYTKRGTPTMGGVMILLAILVGYFAAKLLTGTAVTPSGLLMLFLMVAFGAVGFIDDLIKILDHRSLGLTPWAKMLLLLVVTIVFAVGGLLFRDRHGLTPASTSISFIRDLPIDFMSLGPVAGIILFVVWVELIASGTSNGVNLTDGLDGLATGASIIAFGAYGLITFWQFNQSCVRLVSPGCYSVRDPLDLVIVTFAVCGALVGFLWWNTNPARLFMGDTGSLALGGGLAAVAILSHTELLLVLVGGLFVIITASVIIQTGYFKLSGGKRVFLMAPLHHHFELKGWPAVQVVTRFWILEGLFAAAGIVLFYGEWLAVTR
ncbi:MAG: phospho-N-acetylmuramoyl-pentapeptide-transferase [Microbacteriaceae bacterium]|jgi:phospho-N-acetylmuramoyl-pentapeptide-transferase|nr:phospho-N-acetylmuramoyl-pentapeptide-transferase [Microbacteriaceae bacterium]MCI1207396.1 phospho-N-acetylmuramoyl-pentapeptide-transferase [Microbacteriaceae bacterium]